MQLASKLFTEDQRAAISRTVAEAESKTSAEIAPVVATVSGRYDRAEDMVGLWCSLLVMVSLWLLLPGRTAETGDWAAPSSWWQLIVLILVCVGAFVIGTIAADKVGWLRRLVIPRLQMEQEVAARARELFFDKRIHHTAGGSGLLIYVSLYEHMAAVLAGQNVLEKLGQQALDELCRELTQALRSSHPADAMRQVIQNAGKRLATVLPRAEADVNELSDALVTID